MPPTTPVQLGVGGKELAKFIVGQGLVEVFVQMNLQVLRSFSQLIDTRVLAPRSMRSIHADRIGLKPRTVPRTTGSVRSNNLTMENGKRDGGNGEPSCRWVGSRSRSSAWRRRDRS